jgi:hypothetical protein
MKYKVGDKVKVKSLEWYNANRDNCEILFTPRMLDFCGKIVTVNGIWLDDVYTIQEDDLTFEWTDDMFEDNETSDDLEFQREVAKAVDECLWRVNNEIDIYEETDPTEKLVDDSVEFGKNVMRKKISEYLLKYLPMTPDDKESFVEEMNKNINSN